MPTRPNRLAPAVPALAAVVVLVVAGGGAAYGAWSAAGSGAGAAPAGALVAPSVTATRSTTAPHSAVEVTWSAPGQLPGATYTVTRDGSPISCPASPCSDTGLAPGTTHTYVVTAALGSWRRASDPATAGTDAAAVATALTVSPSATTLTAGTAATVTLTARRADGSTDTGYSGTRTLTWSGAAASTSPGGTAATLPTTATFTNGVTGSLPVTLTTAGTGLALTVGDGSISGTATVSVGVATASRLALHTTTTNQGTAACVFTCSATGLGGNGFLQTKVSVTDAYGNVVSGLGTAVTVDVSRSGAGTLTGPTLTIPATGAAVSTGFTKLQEQGNWSSDTLTLRPRTPATYTQVSATLAK